MAIENFVVYPPLRKKVFFHSLVIIVPYILVGVLLMGAVFLASGITPRLIHVNYDSISASIQMNAAWNALRHPESHPEKSQEEWIKQFDKAISFEETNISEPGEAEIARDIGSLWLQTKKDLPKFDQTSYVQMETLLDRLVQLNEKGMFQLANESTKLGHQVFIASTVLFLVIIFLSFYLADNLAIKIASPLRDFAETLRRKPTPGTRLKLPQPTSLEMRILTHEMLRLWTRLSELQKFNLEELHSQRKRLELVLSSVDDAILVVDNEEEVIHCNPGMSGLIGLDHKDVLGHSWRDLSANNSNYLILRDLLNPAISNSEAVELIVNQKKKVFSARARPFFGKNEEPQGILYLLHDITEIRQRDRLKEEFIGVLSHELKTPLQSLGTAAELLFNKRENAVGDEKILIETIHEDVGRIRAVANEFVQVGLVNLHSLRLKIEKVPLNDHLLQWIQPFQILARDKNVEVQLVKEGSEVIFAQIDVVKFPWAVSNLISNAIRVSPGSIVTLYLTDRERKVDIEVRDEGPGVPPEIQKNMFTPYYQKNFSTDEKITGFLGLGLTITKEVVEAHEGQLEYFPRKPHGSIFRISLPLPY